MGLLNQKEKKHLLYNHVVRACVRVSVCRRAPSNFRPNA